MDANSKINMSLDDIIKLKRAHNKAEKKGAAPPAKGPKGRGNKKFGNKKAQQVPIKGTNRRILKNNNQKNNNNKPRVAPRNVKQNQKKGPVPAKKAPVAAKKQTATVNLNKAATKKLVNNLVKKALKTATRPAVAGRTRLTTRNIRNRAVTGIRARAAGVRSAVASRLSLSNRSRVIRRPVRVIPASQSARSPRTVVVRGRGPARFRQAVQTIQQRPIRVVERAQRAPVVVERAPSRAFIRSLSQNSVVRQIPVQRVQYQQRPVQRRVVYVERSRPQPQRVIIRNVQGGNRRFAPTRNFLPEVVVRRGRGFNGRR